MPDIGMHWNALECYETYHSNPRRFVVMLSVLVCLVAGEEISSPTLIQLPDFLQIWALQSERMCQHTWVVSDELDFR